MKVIIGNYTLDILREGFSWNENCGENGSHVTSSVSCSVRPVDGFLTYLMTAEGNLDAVIKDGDSTLFSGVVRPYTGTSFEGNCQDNIDLEIMDYTESMHIYIYPETTDGQKTGCIYPKLWKGKTLEEVVSALFALAGRIVSFSSSEALPYFKLEGEQYLDDVISELLYEYGLDYKWSADGTAEIFSTFVDDSSVGTVSDVRGTYSISRSDDTTDGLKVTWKEYEYQSNVPLYSFDSGNQTFNEGWTSQVSSTKVLTGKLYSGAMHDSYFNSGSSMPSGNLWTWNFPDLKSGWAYKLTGQTDKATLGDYVILVETDQSKITVTLSDEDGVTYSPTLESYDTEGMRMYVDYSGRFDVALGKGWTWRITVRGDIGIATESEASYNIVGANPDTRELKYRLGLKGSPVISESLVKQLYLRSKYSKITYSWQSLTSYTLGGFYTLEGNTIRIISKTKDENGIYTYRAEGCKPYGETTVSVSTEQKANNRTTSSTPTNARLVSAFATSASKVTAPSSGWLSSVPNMATSLDYLWTKTKDEETDEWSEPTVMAVGVKAVEDKVAVAEDGKSLTKGEEKTPVVVDAAQVIEKETVTREEIDTQSLMAGELIINSGGTIHSEGYAMGDIDKTDESGAYTCSSGFGISSDGAIEAVSGRMRGVVADDLTIVSGAIETVNEAVSGTLTYTEAFPSLSAKWGAKNIYQKTLDDYSSFLGKTKKEGTVTFNGTATSYGFAVHSGAVVNLRFGIYVTESSVSWHVYDLDSYFDDDIQIVVGGITVLQVGPSYDTWIGATKYALFSGIPAIESSFRATVSGGTYNGMTLVSKMWTLTRGTTAFALTYGETTYSLKNGYLAEANWPSYDFTYVSKPKGVYTADIYPKEAGVSKIGDEANEFASIRAINIVGNNVYGAKFNTVELCHFTATGPTTAPLAYSLNGYQFVTIYAYNQYSSGVYTFPASLWSAWSTEESRLVLSTDSRYVGVYFPSASTIAVANLSPQHDIVVYGIV